MTTLVAPSRELWTPQAARALKVPHPSAPGRFRAAKFTSSTGRPRAATTVCEACCGGGPSNPGDPRCCAIPGQTGSRPVGSVPNSFAAGPVMVSINMTLERQSFAEVGAPFPWSSQTVTMVYTKTAVEPNPEYVESSPDRFVCSNLPFTSVTFNAVQTTVQQLLAGGTSTNSVNRSHRITAGVRYGYQQSNGFAGQVTMTLLELFGVNGQWLISAPVGEVLVPGSTRPTQLGIPLQLSQFPPVFVPISYLDAPALIGFNVVGSGSRTFPQQGTGIREITETWNVNISVAGGPFARCPGQAAAGGTGCSDCGASSTGVGGATI